MAKTCATEGCNYPVFSKKLCRVHWLQQYGKPLKQSSKPIQQHTSIKQQTDKEKAIKVTLNKLKASIRLEAVQNNEYYCKGCGKASKYLDCSHILAVGYRKDLELCRDNIQLLDRECHKRWESNNIALMIQLNCFESNLEFIKMHDATMYRKLQTKIDYSSFENLLKTERNVKGKEA